MIRIMKRVLQISKYYYPFLGGTEQVARDMATAMSKLPGIKQKIICFNEDATVGDYVCKKRQTVHDSVDGIEIIRCGYQLKMSSQAMSVTFKRELDKVMNEFNPDLVILHYPNPFATYYLLQHKNKKFKLWVYWHLDITKQKILKHLFYKQNVDLIKRADKILGATPKHLNESAFTELFQEKKQILPYTIDEQSLIVSEREREYAEEIRKKHKGEKIGFFIGRHVPYKGLKYLIEASKKLENEKIHFFIAGSGELTDELKVMAKNDPKIEFLGRISDSERKSYLYACDIFCFPSITRNEGFGLALAEGMYFGKPAVTFTIPGSGVNYVNLDGVTGIECPNCDSQAYAAALKKLCNDDNLKEKYGKAARKRVLDNFTISKFDENIKQLIEDLYI